MKLIRMTVFICAVLAIDISMLGCSGSDQAKEIAPGQFVLDEPIQVAQHSLEKSHKCIIDTINEKPPSKEGTWEIKRGDEAAITGWAFSEDGSAAAPQLFIRLTGAAQTYYAVTTSRSSRPDVNEYFHIGSSLVVGYELRAKTEQIEPGIYALMVMQAIATKVEGCQLPTMLIVN